VSDANSVVRNGSSGLTAESGRSAAVGRESELSAIARFLSTLPRGPAALVIQGEAGIGKSTLWNEAVDGARRTSYSVMSCRPTRSEADLPYLGMGDLLAAVPDQVLAELPIPQRNALEIALLRVEADQHPLQQRAVAAAVLNVLVMMSRTAPLLVAIDDVQWLDGPSRRVLRFAIRRIPGASIGVLVAIRSGGTDEDPLELGSAFAPGRLDHLKVGPLNLKALDRLLRWRLHAAFSTATLRRLEQTSGGNPFFALELGRVLLESPSLLDPGHPLPAPSSLTELLGSRLARLPKVAREVLLVASALSRPTVDLVLEASTSAAASDALEQAAEDGLIELRGGAVRFTHPLFASVLYSQALAVERRRLHKRLAGLVVDPEERARHLGFSAAAPDEAVATAISQGATRAAKRGAPDVAAALLEQATRLTPPTAIREALQRMLDAADQHMAAGDTARASVLLEEVLGSSRPGNIRARALQRLSRVRGLEGDFRATAPLLLNALEEVGEDLPLRVAIERDMAFAQIQVGNPAGALPHALAGLQAAEASGQDILLTEALDSLCLAEFLVGNGLSSELLERAIILDGEMGPAPLLEHPGWGAGRFPLAMTLKWLDRYDQARELLQSLSTEYTDRGDEGSVAGVIFHLGELEWLTGNWDAAARFVDEGHELASRTGQGVAEARALTLEVIVEASRGNVDTARSKAMACIALSESTRDLLSVIRCLRSLGLLELSLGNPDEAVDYLKRGLDLESGAGYDPSVCRILPDAIEAFVAVGRLQEATELVERLEEHGRRLDRRWALAAGARCRGLLAAASGDLARALTELEEALRQHERLPQPFERARTLLALGIVQRRLKKRREARQSLGRALGMFEELGAVLWVERASGELGRISGRAPSLLELTQTEQRIADLVAEGQTNPEVAAALFLSRKTVETNLTRIYHKLDVASRRQLARKMRTRAERPQR
jgi:DNA-binding CsgD family transcriptional regulator